MNLTYPERLELIDLTKARLAKMRLYIAPAVPCNDNRHVNSRDGDASLQLMDKVGCSWKIRRASLLAVANKLRIYLD